MELCDLSAIELMEMLRSGETTSREITSSVLNRIHSKQDRLNAFITITKEEALKQADIADRILKEKGKEAPPLAGIPVAVKDNLCTQGIRTTAGSKILHNFIPTYNATAVDKILRQGAVLVGKTNMDEFGMGSSNENSAYGPARNPLNPEYVTGGSSGGSASAVASGQCAVALGTDTGGSIRLPSAFCGVTGIKPTYGRVSRYGLISYASSLDQIGAIGRTVSDCALLLGAISGHDPMDSTSAPVDCPDFIKSINREIKGIRLGIPKEYFVEGIDPGIKDKIFNAVTSLEKEGAEIVEINLPHTKYAISAYYLIATAEASSNLARYDGVKYGLRANPEPKDIISMYEETRSQGFGTEVKRRIMLGSYVLSAGYYDAYYLKAQKVRRLIREDFDRAFKKVDCLIAPVSPVLPFKLGERLEDPLQMYLVDIYTVSLNLSGLPGISVPCGKLGDFPVGLQVIGKTFDEATILNLGHIIEKITESV